MRFKSLSVLLASIFFNSLLYCATISNGAGSYTDTLPSGFSAPPSLVYKSSNVASPLPTNDWWTSIISSTYSARIYAYPFVYKCQNTGLLIGVPETITNSDYVYEGSDSIPPYRQQILATAVFNAQTSTVTAVSTDVDSYSDWSVTPLWVDSSDPGKYFKATIGHGFVFTYLEYSLNSDPRLLFPLDWSLGQFDIYYSSGTLIPFDTPVTADRVTLMFSHYSSGKKVYFGLFAPQGSVFKLSGSGHIIDITLPASGRYLSIGAMTKADDLSVLYNYAYSFIRDTKTEYSYNSSNSLVYTTFTITAQSMQYSQTVPLTALFPHQWKNYSGSFLSQEFVTLRGKMKLSALNTFSLSYRFSGILPFLPDAGGYDKTHLQALLDSEKNNGFGYLTTYYHGKELAKLANMLPIADELGDTQSKSTIITRLKNDLANWLSYSSGENYGFFYYNQLWGSMIGYDTEASFGQQNFNDQHFHFGYFVYAAALLAMYDTGFKTDYGSMVELLIRSYASPNRNDNMFPYLRTFDVYESHSWANGLGQSDDGNDQESSSEAMNSWAAIYLWGLATANTTYLDLGVWGYTSEYQAVKEYYFDIDKTNYTAGYGHTSIGRLFGGKVDFNTWFGSDPEFIHGIQILPLTPSMLYLGYDSTYAKKNYDDMVLNNGGVETKWRDIFWRYQVLFDTANALSKYDESISYEQGNSKTLTYKWINTFKELCSVDASVYADAPAYAVFNNNGKKNYVCYNEVSSTKTINFYSVASGQLLASLSAAPGKTARVEIIYANPLSTGTVVNPSNNISAPVKVYPNPYKNTGNGIVFEGLNVNSEVKIFNITGELIADFIETDGDGFYTWDCTNKSGNKIASGVYIFCIIDGSTKKKEIGKFAVIK